MQNSSPEHRTIKGPGLSSMARLQPGYLPLKEAAEWTGISVRTLKRWIGRGLAKHQAGPREKVLIRLADVETFLTKKQQPTVDLEAMIAEVLASLNRDTEGIQALTQARKT